MKFKFENFELGFLKLDFEIKRFGKFKFEIWSLEFEIGNLKF